jgi:hypothetical protein
LIESAEIRTTEEPPSAMAKVEEKAIVPPSGGSLELGGYAVDVALRGWHLWMPGKVLRKVEGVELSPATSRTINSISQTLFQTYFTRVLEFLSPLPEGDGPLYLHVDVDVGRRERFLEGPRLIGYVIPVIGRLGQQRFVHVSASKRVGGGSRILLGRAETLKSLPEGQHWGHFTSPTLGDPMDEHWERALKATIAQTFMEPLPPGPVAVHLAWRCAPGRNWVTLWEPTSAALGPVIGEPKGNGVGENREDRIDYLGLHIERSETIGDRVDVGLWWWHPDT